jgi:hypothetical protein
VIPEAGRGSAAGVSSCIMGRVAIRRSSFEHKPGTAAPPV